ncbi:DoxX family protein [Actinoplanes sp. NPDC000266]
MNVFLWIVAAVLAVAFLGAGVMKLLQPKEKLVASGMGWASDWPAGSIKLIGAVEVLAAIGLILPRALDIAPVLTPLAAVGLAVVMAGAIVVHLRRKEPQMAAANAVLLILAVIVAAGRF